MKLFLLLLLVCLTGPKTYAAPFLEKHVSQDSISEKLSISLIKRYGSSSRKLESGWKILLASGYSIKTISFIDTTKMTLLHAVFTTDKGPAMQTSEQQRILLPALDLFNDCIPEFKENPRFVADLTSLTAECLNRYLNQVELKCAHSLAEKDKNGYKKWSDKFLKTAFDFNNLLKVIPSTSGKAWELKIPAQRKQWFLLINYGKECFISHKKFNPAFIAQQPLNTFVVRGVMHTSMMFDVHNSVTLSQQIYSRYLDIDIGFE